MSELDRASLDRTLPPRSGSADWDEVLRGAGAGRERRGRRLVAVVAALLVLVVGTASAFGTVRDLFGNGKPHVARGFYPSEGKRGSFTVRLLTIATGGEQDRRLVRRWSIVPEPTMGTPSPTGQYVQVSGQGRILRMGGHAQAWSARLVGFMSRPGEAKQRVVITMKGRPKGVFVLTPLQPGVLKRDSGTHEHTATIG
jgi:hypothetical protein